MTGTSYDNACEILGIALMVDRTDSLCDKLFHSITSDKDQERNSLLPPLRSLFYIKIWTRNISFFLLGLIRLTPNRRRLLKVKKKTRTITLSLFYIKIWTRNISFFLLGLIRFLLWFKRYIARALLGRCSWRSPMQISLMQRAPESPSTLRRQFGRPSEKCSPL